MRKALRLCSVGVLMVTAVPGCGHERTVVRKETTTVQTMPAPTPVMEKRTTTTTEHHSTTVEEE